MRITIRLDDQLHAKAKKRAYEQGITLGAFIENSLREAIYRRESPPRRRRSRLPTAGGDGVLPGMD